MDSTQLYNLGTSLLAELDVLGATHWAAAAAPASDLELVVDDPLASCGMQVLRVARELQEIPLLPDATERPPAPHEESGSTPRTQRVRHGLRSLGQAMRERADDVPIASGLVALDRSDGSDGSDRAECARAKFPAEPMDQPLSVAASGDIPTAATLTADDAVLEESSVSSLPVVQPERPDGGSGEIASTEARPDVVPRTVKLDSRRISLGEDSVSAATLVRSAVRGFPLGNENVSEEKQDVSDEKREGSSPRRSPLATPSATCDSRLAACNVGELRQDPGFLTPDAGLGLTAGAVELEGDSGSLTPEAGLSRTRVRPTLRSLPGNGRGHDASPETPDDTQGDLVSVGQADNQTEVCHRVSDGGSQHVSRMMRDRAPDFAKAMSDRPNTEHRTPNPLTPLEPPPFPRRDDVREQARQTVNRIAADFRRFYGGR